MHVLVLVLLCLCNAARKASFDRYLGLPLKAVNVQSSHAPIEGPAQAVSRVNYNFSHCATREHSNAFDSQMHNKPVRQPLMQFSIDDVEANVDKSFDKVPHVSVPSSQGVLASGTDQQVLDLEKMTGQLTISSVMARPLAIRQTSPSNTVHMGASKACAATPFASVVAVSVLSSEPPIVPKSYSPDAVTSSQMHTQGQSAFKTIRRITVENVVLRDESSTLPSGGQCDVDERTRVCADIDTKDEVLVESNSFDGVEGNYSCDSCISSEYSDEHANNSDNDAIDPYAALRDHFSAPFRTIVSEDLVLRTNTPETPSSEMKWLDRTHHADSFSTFVAHPEALRSLKLAGKLRKEIKSGRVNAKRAKNHRHE